MALTRSRASTATVSQLGHSSTHMNSMSIPIRFQCPLCLDVLRRPIQLPCCQRYLCMECFERGLELTSVNCGFCRRRVVGFARTKQYKVDEVMWKAIKIKCPFLEHIENDREPLVEFFDEDAPPLHTSNHNSVEQEHLMSNSTENKSPSGEFQAFYHCQLQKHQSQVQEAERRALRQTIDFLQNDPELTASLTASSFPTSSTPSSILSSRPIVASQGAKKKMKMSTTSTTSHRPITRSLNVIDDKQAKLDGCFGSSRTTLSQSETSGQSTRCAYSTSDGLSSPRTRTGLKINEPNRKYYLRSTSHSPTSTKDRRRKHIKGCKPLRQLTLDTTISPIALHTRSQDLKRASSVGSEPEPSKMLTRQGRRRNSWKCTECTYTNTCFDHRCSMCRCLPPLGT
ncbi:unnamed protein product [Peronospora belbahrii]|uniref:RING-type E3 ubiquitin transferase n=1 Tax=Peronospora belbahrii TaxID=622444 RepID=A0AAU9KUT0_9STRA|nr:unnamed protein product [Peronospora belbahrii]CAH0516567.1 unnamed protein product [Peronospora belbahrii]